MKNLKLDKSKYFWTFEELKNHTLAKLIKNSPPPNSIKHLFSKAIKKLNK